jgi:hypothetical protein
MIWKLLTSRVELKENQLAKEPKIYTLKKWQKLHLSDKFNRKNVI